MRTRRRHLLLGHEHPRAHGAGRRGAGGIGFVLNEAIVGLEWGRVGLILLVIPGVVEVSEGVSAWAPRRPT